ncbi:DEAD/DEAH box helicase, partial [Candidatus Woesearchaeota archaeon]|nr:DEAD/DEAH box helicase [Candidatus Woesearchaeota archaeon]
MEYKGLVLDEFQVESINSINKHHSIIVSAPTGSGKTLVADYVIDKAINDGKKVIYT